MKTIIAVSGSKGVGKTSLCRYLHTLYEMRIGNLIYNDGSEIDHNANLVQYPDTGRTQVMIERSGINYSVKLKSEADSGIFSFATKIKRLSVDILGLSQDGVFGSESSKNNSSLYSWDKMPIWARWTNSAHRSVLTSSGEYEVDSSEISKIKTENDLWTFCCDVNGMPSRLRSGSMTNREVMQVVGTDIFRNFFDRNVWVKSTLDEILASNFGLCFIDDMRFDSEANTVLSNNGYILVLSRNLGENDAHESEKGISDYAILSNPRVFHIPPYSDIMEKNMSVVSVIDEIILNQVNNRVSTSQQVST
jgi:energy-coupling factor transporter ATP-binding protein EcfA2